MWGGSVYAVALHDFDVGICAGGRAMTMKTAEWEIFEDRSDPKYVYAHVVGETPAGKAAGIQYYRKMFSRHECGWPYDDTGLTCKLRRRHNC
jgi:hypothetical protein